jgi:hypothetical protein
LNALKYSSPLDVSIPTRLNKNDLLQIPLDALTIKDKNDTASTDKTKSFEKNMCAIHFLIQNGGRESVMTQDYNGVTSLHWASEYGCVKVMKLLIEAGGRDLIFVKDSWGKTAMDYARQGENGDALDLLNDCTLR